MAMTIKYFTPEGLQKLKTELQDLKTRGRREMAQKIAEAREKGDLSENAEYDAAKEEQGLLEMRIAKLEGEVGAARLLDDSKLDASKIMILSKIKLKNLKRNKVVQYMLVTESEANVRQGKISVSTPIAKGLLGKRAGDKVKIKVPSGMLEFEVLDVSR